MTVLRFPNPGSDINKFVTTFETIFEKLRGRTDFGHYDMGNVLATTGLVSSQGAIGEEALRRSTREDTTRDPIYNQVKMYSELYRMLGWLRPGSDRTHFVFSDLSGYIKSPMSGIEELITECIFNIVFPNPNVETRTGNNIRPFLFLLNIIEGLGGIIYRDEIILSTLACENDRLEYSLETQISKIIEIRRDYDKLKSELRSAAEDKQVNTVQNYTRFPIGIIRDMGWVEEVRNREIYNKSLKMLKITSKGEKICSKYNGLYDIRYQDLNKFSLDEKAFFGALSYYIKIQRSGYEMSDIDRDHIETLSDLSTRVMEGLNITDVDKILFCPYQQLYDLEVNRMEYLDTELWG